MQDILNLLTQPLLWRLTSRPKYSLMPIQPQRVEVAAIPSYGVAGCVPPNDYCARNLIAKAIDQG
jgi:hypothetical protein